jgi:two-component system alkaline phosphatase synthesis response regulator PhoP
VGDIAINYGTYQVTVKGKKINLSPKEYDIINVFMKNPGKLLTRKALCDMVWGHKTVGNYNKIDKYVLILRSKLEECGSYIKTAWGLGYRFVPHSGTLPTNRPNMESQCDSPSL